LNVSANRWLNFRQKGAVDQIAERLMAEEPFCSAPSHPAVITEAREMSGFSKFTMIEWRICRSTSQTDALRRCAAKRRKRTHCAQFEIFGL
jgi:hypothetical protein